jgi:hypothetical protein
MYERRLLEAVDAGWNELRRLAPRHAAPLLIAMPETNSSARPPADETVVTEIDGSIPEEIGSPIGLHVGYDLNADQHGPEDSQKAAEALPAAWSDPDTRWCGAVA